MSITLPAFPTFDVLRWDASQVYVRCWYREGIHRHEPVLSGSGRSRCPRGGEYEFALPIDTENELVGYEIAKRRALFVNAKFKEEDHRNEKTLTDLFHSNMNLSDTGPDSSDLPTDGKETLCFTIPSGKLLVERNLKWALINCGEGNVGAVRLYLETSDVTTSFYTAETILGTQP